MPLYLRVHSVPSPPGRDHRRRDARTKRSWPRQPRTAEEFYRVGVATELMYERTLFVEELRRCGVEVLDSRADQVAARAIERYLDLKSRLRL